MSEVKEADEEKTNLDLITTSISQCISTGQSAMNEKVIEAARKYYLSIVNNEELSIDQKRHKIYHDLVIGTKASDKESLQHSDYNKVSFSYRVGLENDQISVVNGLIVCVGQYKENDIYIPSEHVSRIHCFIFRINEKLIILDSWSKCGTKTVTVATENNFEVLDGNNEKRLKKRKLISSLPKQRNILQFNVNDTIHLILGDDKYGTQFIINPKTCIVCIDRARTRRLKCGHQVLCNKCYDKIKQNIYSAQCPICRKPFHQKINKWNANYADPATISAGIHTFACSDNVSAPNK